MACSAAKGTADSTRCQTDALIVGRRDEANRASCWGSDGWIRGKLVTLLGVSP